MDRFRVQYHTVKDGYVQVEVKKKSEAITLAVAGVLQSSNDHAEVVGIDDSEENWNLGFESYWDLSKGKIVRTQHGE